MRLWLALLSIIACSASLQAAECYRSECRRDLTGTLWCDNQEIPCSDLAKASCVRSGNLELKQNANDTVLSCSFPDGDRDPVRIQRCRPRPEPLEYDDYPRGGLGGFGARTGPGDEWDLYNDDSTLRDIETDDHALSDIEPDNGTAGEIEP
ncbi:MAG TPA: hypothetical protein VEK08_20485 [Planctomycetota bacterium]|nr:hypothetical protein [Planctomycetota bacterium]